MSPVKKAGGQEQRRALRSPSPERRNEDCDPPFGAPVQVGHGAAFVRNRWLGVSSGRCAASTPDKERSEADRFGFAEQPPDHPVCRRWSEGGVCAVRAVRQLSHLDLVSDCIHVHPNEGKPLREPCGNGEHLRECRRLGIGGIRDPAARRRSRACSIRCRSSSGNVSRIGRCRAE